MSSIKKRMFCVIVLSILIVSQAAYFFITNNKLSGFIFASFNQEELNNCKEAAQEFALMTKNSATQLVLSHKQYAYDYIDEQNDGDGYKTMLNNIEKAYSDFCSAILQANDNEQIKQLLNSYITVLLDKSVGIGAGQYTRWDRGLTKIDDNWPQQVAEIEQTISGWAKVLPVYAIFTIASSNYNKGNSVRQAIDSGLTNLGLFALWPDQAYLFNPNPNSIPYTYTGALSALGNNAVSFLQAFDFILSVASSLHYEAAELENYKAEKLNQIEKEENEYVIILDSYALPAKNNYLNHIDQLKTQVKVSISCAQSKEEVDRAFFEYTNLEQTGKRDKLRNLVFLIDKSIIDAQSQNESYLDTLINQSVITEYQKRINDALCNLYIQLETVQSISVITDLLSTCFNEIIPIRQLFKLIDEKLSEIFYLEDQFRANYYSKYSEFKFDVEHSYGFIAKSKYDYVWQQEIEPLIFSLINSQEQQQVLNIYQNIQDKAEYARTLTIALESVFVIFTTYKEIAKATEEYQPIIRAIFDKYFLVGENYLGNLQTEQEILFSSNSLEKEIKSSLLLFEKEKSNSFFQEETNNYLNIVYKSVIKGEVNQFFLKEYINFFSIFEKYLSPNGLITIANSFESVIELRNMMAKEICQESLLAAKEMRLSELLNYINLLIENNKTGFCQLEISFFDEIISEWNQLLNLLTFNELIDDKSILIIPFIQKVDLLLNKLIKELPVNYSKEIFDQEVRDILEFFKQNFDVNYTKKSFEKIENKYFNSIIGLIIKAKTEDEIKAYLDNALTELNEEKTKLCACLQQRNLAESLLENIKDILVEYTSSMFINRLNGYIDTLYLLDSAAQVLIVMESAQNYIQNYLWQHSNAILVKLADDIKALLSQDGYFEKEKVKKLQEINTLLFEYGLDLQNFDPFANQILQTAIEMLPNIYLIEITYDQNFFFFEFAQNISVLSIIPNEDKGIIYQLYLKNPLLDFKIIEKTGWKFTGLTYSDKNGYYKNISEYLPIFSLDLSCVKDNYCHIVINPAAKKEYKYIVHTSVDNPNNIIETSAIVATYNFEIGGIYFFGYHNELIDPLSKDGILSKLYPEVEFVFDGFRLFSFSGQKIITGQILYDEQTIIFARYITVKISDDVLANEVYGVKVEINKEIKISYYDTIKKDDKQSFFVRCPLFFAARVNINYDFPASYALLNKNNLLGTDFFINLGSESKVFDSQTFYWFDSIGNLLAVNKIFYSVDAYITHFVSFTDQKQGFYDYKIQVLDGNFLGFSKEFLENNLLNIPLGSRKVFADNEYIFLGHFDESENLIDLVPIKKETKLNALWLEKTSLPKENILPLSPYAHDFSFISINGIQGLKIEHIGIYDKNALDSDVSEELVLLGHTDNKEIREYGALFFAPNEYAYGYLINSLNELKHVNVNYNKKSALSIYMPFAVKQEGYWQFTLSNLKELSNQKPQIIQLTNYNGIDYFKISFTICFLDNKAGVFFDFFFLVRAYDEYIVNFDLNGGSFEEYQEYEIIVSYGDTLKAPIEPKKAGYSFIGWFLDETQFEFEESRIYSDIILVAKWQPKSLIVYYYQNLYDQQPYLTQEIFLGQSIENILIFKDGYIFDGWRFSDGKRVDHNLPIENTADLEIEVYASLVKIEKAQDIKIIEGDAPKNLILIPPSEQTADLNAYVVDYLDIVNFDTFIYPDDFSDLLDKDKLYIRLFVAAPTAFKKYSFDYYGQKIISENFGCYIYFPIAKKVNGKFTPLGSGNRRTKDNLFGEYYQIYWFDKEENLLAVSECEIRLFNYQEILVTFDYNFKLDNVIQSFRILYGNKAPNPVKIERVGYSFLWWEDLINKGKPFDLHSSLSRNTTLIAAYDIHKSRLEFRLPNGHIAIDHTGKEIEPILVEYDDYITPPIAFLHGHKFEYWTALVPSDSGWNFKPLAFDFSKPFKLLSDIILYAYFTQDQADSFDKESLNSEKQSKSTEKFEAIVDYDDEVNLYSIKDIDYGSILSEYKPINPNKGINYYFAGWYIFDKETNTYLDVFDWDNSIIVSNIYIKARWVNVTNLTAKDLNFGDNILDNFAIVDDGNSVQINYTKVIDWNTYSLEHLVNHDNKYWIRIYFNLQGCSRYRINDEIRDTNYIEVPLAQIDGQKIVSLFGSHYFAIAALNENEEVTKAYSLNIYLQEYKECLITYFYNFPFDAIDEPKTERVILGEKVELPILELEGYRFLGWTTIKNDAKTLLEGSIIIATNDFVFYALWQEIECVIEFFDGDNFLTSLTVKYNTLASTLKYDIPTITLKDGFYFVGFADSSGKLYEFNQQTVIKNDLKLYAKIVPIKIISAKEVNLDKTNTAFCSIYVTDLIKTIKIDNSFVSFVGLDYFSVINKDKINSKSLNIWVELKDNLTFELLSFDYFWQQAVLSPVIYSGNISLNIPIINNKGEFFGDGYRLDDNNLFFTLKLFAKDQDQNIVAVYYWAGTLLDYQESEITLEFDNKEFDNPDEIYQPIKINAIIGKSLIINENDYKKSGRDFCGWRIKGTNFYFDFKTDVFTTEKITLVAEYRFKEYTITFMDKGSNGDYVIKDELTQKVIYHAKAQRPNGYCFNTQKGYDNVYWTATPTQKWQDLWQNGYNLPAEYDFDSSVLDHIVLYAFYVPNTYKIVFIVGEDAFLELDFYYGTNLVPPKTEPKIEGKLFTGWYADKDCKVKFDFTAPIDAENYSIIKIYAGFVDITALPLNRLICQYEINFKYSYQIYDGKTSLNFIYDLDRNNFIDWTKFEQVLILIKILAPNSAKKAFLIISGEEILLSIKQNNVYYIDFQIFASVMQEGKLIPLSVQKDIQVLWKDESDNIIAVENLTISVESFVTALERYINFIMLEEYSIEEIFNLENQVIPTINFLQDLMPYEIVRDFKEWILSSIKNLFNAKITDKFELIVANYELKEERVALLKFYLNQGIQDIKNAYQTGLVLLAYEETIALFDLFILQEELNYAKLVAIDGLIIPNGYPIELFAEILNIYKALINSATSQEEISDYLNQALLAIEKIKQNYDEKQEQSNLAKELKEAKKAAITSLTIPSGYPSDLFTQTINIYKSLISSASDIEEVNRYFAQALQEINNIKDKYDKEQYQKNFDIELKKAKEAAIAKLTCPDEYPFELFEQAINIFTLLITSAKNPDEVENYLYQALQMMENIKLQYDTKKELEGQEKEITDAKLAALSNLIIPNDYPAELFTDVINIYKSLIKSATSLEEIDDYLLKALQTIEKIKQSFNLEKETFKKSEEEYKKAIQNALSLEYITNVIMYVLNDYLPVSYSNVSNLSLVEEKKESLINELRLILEPADISREAKDKILLAVEKYYDSISSFNALISPYAYILSTYEQLKGELLSIKLQENQKDAFLAAEVIAIINSLGQNPEKSEIKKARDKYEALTLRQKNLVNNYAALIAAEKTGEFSVWLTIAALLLITLLIILSILLVLIIKIQKKNKFKKA